MKIVRLEGDGPFALPSTQSAEALRVEPGAVKLSLVCRLVERGSDGAAVSRLVTLETQMGKYL